MAIINQSNILNLQPGITAPVVVHMSEGDSGTKLSFKLIDGARAWTDPGNVVAAVHGRRQDGTQFGPYACTISGDVVSFETDAAIAAVAGSGIAQIVLTDSDQNTAGTANFAIMVERATFPMGVTYTNDKSVYEAILAYVQTIPAAVTEDYTTKIEAEAAAREAADASLQGQISAEASARSTQDAVLSARMDEFTKLPDGSMSTAADAELVDIRVKADGIKASTAGNAVREQITELKNDLTSILENQYILVYTGDVSGTRQVNVTGLAIPAGTYTFFVDSVTSSDTDDTTCRVIFVNNNTTVANVYAQRTTNYATTVTLANAVDEIRFFAANSYGNAAGDTFAFNGVSIYDANTNLRNELLASIKYKGRSNDVGLTDANNAAKGSVYNIANGVAISNLPSFSTEGVLITTGGSYPVQLFFVDGIFYKRYLRGSAWTEWKTNAEDTTTFKFKGRSNSVGLTDANNAEKNTIYNTAGTVVMANLPYSANEGVLITTGGDFPVQLYFVNDGFYKRYYRGADNGWGAWTNTGVEVETTPSNLIANIKQYNGTGVTLRLSNETFDIIDIYKSYYGNDWFDNYTGWNGQSDYFTRGLYLTGIKIKGRPNTKFIMSSDTGNTAVRTHFSIFAPYTDVTIEDLTIDIGDRFCRYCIHDDFAPQNCKMIYKNLVMLGASYNANALYGMGCGSGVEYDFENCWMMSGTARAWYGHSAPNQTKPCIVKIKNCTTYQNVGFKWYSDYSGVNIGYVDKSVQNVTCDAYYDAQTVNFNVYHDTGTVIELLPAS